MEWLRYIRGSRHNMEDKGLQTGLFDSLVEKGVVTEIVCNDDRVALASHIIPDLINRKWIIEDTWGLTYPETFERRYWRFPGSARELLDKLGNRKAGA